MRRTYLDNLRWITVLLVVVYHVIYMFNGVTTYGVMGPLMAHQPQDLYLYIVYPWFMFLLFVISGMSARFELETNGEKGFIRRRTRKYLVPSTIGLLVFQWILGYFNMQISRAFETMGAVPKPALYLIMCVSGIGPLWYIQLLWVFSAFLIFVRKLTKDKLYTLGKRANVFALLLLTVAVCGAAQILNTPVIVVYRFGIYGLAFLLGYTMFSHDEVMEKLEKYRWLFYICAVVSGIVFVIVFWGKSYPGHEVMDTLLCNAYTWFGTLAVLSFMKKWGNFKNAFSEWMGRKAWGIYLFHYLGIASCAWCLINSFPALPPVIVYLSVTISGFAGALILYEIFSRIPILRWCVLGLGKKKGKIE